MSSSVAGAVMIGFLGARFEMGAHLRARGKDARRLDDDIDAEVFPRQSQWLFLIQDGDVAPVDLYHAFTDRDFSRKNSVIGIVTQQMRVGS